MSKRRRGSSTRKKHFSGNNVSKKSTSEEKQKAILLKIERQISTNKSSKGMSLSNDEMNKLKVRQANLEHILGITHEQ